MAGRSSRDTRSTKTQEALTPKVRFRDFGIVRRHTLYMPRARERACVLPRAHNTPEPRRFEPHPHPGSWPGAGMSHKSALLRACVVLRITLRYLRTPPLRISGSAGEATRPKIVATEKIVIFFVIRTVLGIGTGNSSAVVSVVPSDRSSKRGALLGPKRHPKCQDRASIGVTPRKLV